MHPCTGRHKLMPSTNLRHLPVPCQGALICFLRLTVGCYASSNVAAGWEGVPALQRLCPLCGADFCNERHTLLDCPDIGGIAAYGQLFAAHMYVNQFVAGCHCMVMRYINESLGTFAAA